MKKSNQFFSAFITLLLFSLSAFTQTKNTGYKLSKNKTWQLLDYQQDSVYGASVNRAYNELLKGKKSHPVIVAVIDEGVDIAQEDLKGHIWNNKKEIPGNGIDDDKNGYTDDIHGWNFLGGKNGKMIYATNSEADREYARLSPQYSTIKDSSQASDKKQYQYFLTVKKRHRQDSAGRKEDNYTSQSNYIHQLASADSFMQRAIQKQSVYYKDIELFQPKDSLADTIKSFLLDFFNQSSSVFESISLDSSIKEGQEYLVKHKDELLLYEQVRNDPFELRKEIVGDDPFDINDRNYGNNIVGDKYAGHGTHCSGIIAAGRNNGIGIDGITDNVFIMPVRAVNTLHYGDETDKDLALAIRYAVDNGAKIISMSFGKDFSPQKQWVDAAVKYAGEKNILLVHAAGNNGRNIDAISFYPNANFLGSSERAKNLITVGAISSDTGFTLVASFSNYGQKEVDLFAPGVDIYSSVPGNDYEFDSGTSMATPVVAGIAALILEYYPGLTAEQLKYIIMKSVTSLKGKMVNKPGSKEKTDFSTLCVSGGIVNAYKALQLAASMTSKKR
ncbi:MAG: S8 family peptidase [Bacteroidota bacterium]|nr:S8 family peptidase [Bacteroidota bacterium]